MFIRELTGYKENPIYQKAKSIFVSTPRKGQTRSKEDIRDEKLSNFTKELEKFKFKHIGSGSFGSVYSKAGYPWIFKIFNTDPAYLYYLKWAVLHQNNPHVPKIKGKLLKINDDTYAVRIEKLKLFVRKNEKLAQFQQRLDKYIGTRRKLTTVDHNWFEQNFPKMIELIDAMKNSGYPFDIHMNNMMMRGNVPVIIDPIYLPKNLE